MNKGSFFPNQPDVILYGDESNERIGDRIVALGDLNNDGFDDFAVSAQSAQSASGRIYIVFGGPRGGVLKSGNVRAVSRVIIIGSPASFLGAAMTAAGVSGIPDLNGDKVADLIVSAPRESNSSGKSGVVHIFYGRQNYPSSSANPLILRHKDVQFSDITIENDNLDTQFFATGLAIADVNKDNHADLFIASFQNARITTFFGPLQPTTGTSVIKTSKETFHIQGIKGSNFGNSLAIIGDINKDTYPELAVTADRAKLGNAQTGAVYVYSGDLMRQRNNLDADKSPALKYYNKGFTSIQSVSPAGDIDKDGFDDFLVGDGNVDLKGNNSGAVYLIFGND
ncbi:MAG: hypothetical protein AAGJ35_05965, partial [Myxococcota bacterium]